MVRKQKYEDNYLKISELTDRQPYKCNKNICYKYTNSKGMKILQLAFFTMLAVLAVAQCPDVLCPQPKSTVCVVRSRGLPYEYDNPCSASCLNDIIKIYEGRCTKYFKYCTGIHMVDCTQSENTGVYCAFSLHGPPTSVTSNRCCQLGNQKAFMNGACHTKLGTTPQPPITLPPPKRVTILCLISNSLLSCTTPRDLVCGSVGNIQKTYRNWCQACKKGATNYTKGPCRRSGPSGMRDDIFIEDPWFNR